MKHDHVLIRICMVLSLILLLVSTPLVANELPMLSEVRIGVFAHDVDAVSFKRESGIDLHGELLFLPPDSEFIRMIGNPYPHIGVKLNSKGNTSQAYTGFTWRWYHQQPFFLEGILGGVIHDGDLDLETAGRKALGSRALFRLGIAIGYEVTQNVTVSLMFDHISNAYLKSANEGLDTVGVLFGYKF